MVVRFKLSFLILGIGLLLAIIGGFVIQGYSMLQFALFMGGILLLAVGFLAYSLLLRKR
jgi:hypothetical protein